MPHATLKLLPGVDQNRTQALNESAISVTNLVRFVPDKQNLGLVQKLGGWTKYYASDIQSPVRALWAWEDTNANQYLGVGNETVYLPTTAATGNGTTATITFSGTHSFNANDVIVVSGVTPTGFNGAQTITSATSNTVSFASAATGPQTVAGYIYPADNLSVIEAGTQQIITPRSDAQNVAVSVDTTNGSSAVQINASASNINNFDTIDIVTQISVGGLVLFGNYSAIFVDSNNFNIIARDALGNPQNATSTVTNGGAVPTFTFTSGQSYVDVTLADHNLLVGDTFPILVSTTGGGVTLYGNYTVISVASTSSFRIIANNKASTATVTNASGSAGTATLTYSGNYSIAVGDTIVVAGMNPAGYDGTHVVTAVGTSTVSFTNGTTGFTSGGTIFASIARMNGGLARYTYYRAPLPLPSSTGYGVGGYGDGGYGNGVAPTAVYGTPIVSVDWTFDNWGDIFIACPVYNVSDDSGGQIYQWAPASGASYASIITNAPIVNDGVFVAMPQRQIIAWGSTFTGIQDPLLIRWCDVNDFDSWIPLVINQAGSYRIPKGSRIVCGIQGPQQGLIWTDLAVWAMQYVGPPYVYQFNELGTGCGLIARKAAGSMNNVVYWMGQSQFFKLSGNGVEPIRCPIWDVIFQDLDRNNLSKIRIAPNSRFGEISWYYPTTTNGGEVTKYVKYNVVLDQWDFGTLSRTAWINESVLGPPIGAGTTDGYYIYQHETSTDADGAPLLASFQTGYFAMTEGELKMFVDQVWPDMKWGYYDQAQSATVNLTFYVTDYPGQTPVAFGPYAMTQATTFLTPRFRGRLVSFKLDSSDIGSFWRIGAMRYRFEQDGKF